jgi:hypothetical protein
MSPAIPSAAINMQIVVLTPTVRSRMIPMMMNGTDSAKHNT